MPPGRPPAATSSSDGGRSLRGRWKRRFLGMRCLPQSEALHSRCAQRHAMRPANRACSARICTRLVRETLWDRVCIVVLFCMCM